MEAGEPPIEALEREILEETVYRARIGEFIGVYSVPFKDDLVLFFEAETLGRADWQPDGEIAEVAFFGRDELPATMGARARVRSADAFSGVRGVVRVFESP